MLSKAYCGEPRITYLKRTINCVKTQRDYAERLSAHLNLEIQSDHFGNGQSLLIEGSSVEFVDTTTNDVVLHFHSHFSDSSL